MMEVMRVVQCVRGGGEIKGGRQENDAFARWTVRTAGLVSQEK